MSCGRLSTCGFDAAPDFLGVLAILENLAHLAVDVLFAGLAPRVQVGRPKWHGRGHRTAPLERRDSSGLVEDDATEYADGEHQNDDEEIGRAHV